MAEENSSSTDKGSHQQGESLATQLASILSSLQTQPEINQNQNNMPQSFSINIKLNQFNYSLWSRLMKMEIGGRGKLHHLTGNPPPPAPDSPAFAKWEQTDLIVCTWLLHNMEPELVTLFAEYPSAKTMWDSLNSTYSQSSDGLQIFDLTVRANNMKQGTDSIETYYSKLQRIWREIEIRQTNPMACERDIAAFNRLRANTQLFQFLAGLDEKYESDRRDLLKEDPLPTVEKAYATIRREGNRREILGRGQSSSASDNGVGAGLLAGKQVSRNTGLGRGRRPYLRGSGPPRHTPATPRWNPNNGSTKHSSGSSTTNSGGPPQCDHCNRIGHKIEGCYEIIGWPEGWRSRRRDTTTPTYGAASVGVGEADTATNNRN